MARKYDPNRPSAPDRRRAQASGPHLMDHEPGTGWHRHAHPLFGDGASHDHRHAGDGRHGGIEFDAGPCAGALPGPEFVSAGYGGGYGPGFSSGYGDGRAGRIMAAAGDEDGPVCLTCSGRGRLLHPVTGHKGRVCPSCLGTGVYDPDNPPDAAAQARGVIFSGRVLEELRRNLPPLLTDKGAR